jgi:hypothetical protein
MLLIEFINEPIALDAAPRTHLSDENVATMRELTARGRQLVSGM